MTKTPEPTLASAIHQYDDIADVVIIGFGIAGACAALEARRENADVLVLERASGGGGASALSAGIFYFGGGTSVQHAVGIEDSPDEMYKFLMASTGAPDAKLVRRYCDESVAHFDWLEAQGIPFKRSYYKDKSVVAPTDDCLASTGNEKVWPYADIAKPAPRGHKVAQEGNGGGALAMNALVAKCESEGVRISNDTRVTTLIRDEASRIVGVTAKRDGNQITIRARRGVILAAGGFGMNKAYVETWCPDFPSTGVEPIGIPNNDGSALDLALSMGAATQAMSGTIATASFYPPAKLIKGILINQRGERFVAEDAYHGRTAEFIAEQPGGIAYLILDSETFDYPENARAAHRLVDGFESVQEMEAALELPEGSLVSTLQMYNASAKDGQDSLYHKHADWVQPLVHAPFAAFEVGYNNSLYHFLTLGGIQTNAEAEVLDAQGQVIPGFYAAGACASSIPQDGKGYASGLSLGPGSYFGRVAGKNAARSIDNES